MRTWIVPLLLCTSVARADVIEWRDSQGVRHFTNLAAEVPEEYRDVAKSVISEEQWRSKAPEPQPAAAPPPPPQENPPAPSYRDGFDAGLAYARDAVPPAIRIEPAAPQVIITAPPPAAAVYPWVGPAPYWAAFDGGRTRHITRRMIEQNMAWHEDVLPYFPEPARIVLSRRPLGGGDWLRR